MCKWRQIQDTFAVCNHTYKLPDEMLFCDDKKCKFSPKHESPSYLEYCGPNCTTTCWQYRQFPEQILRRLDRLCPMCEQDPQLRQQYQQQQQQQQQQQN